MACNQRTNRITPKETAHCSAHAGARTTWEVFHWSANAVVGALREAVRASANPLRLRLRMVDAPDRSWPGSQGLRLALALSLILILGPRLAWAADAAQTPPAQPVTMCVFDMLGAAGPTNKALRSYQTEALKWGVAFSFKSYGDERVAAEAFNQGVCDLVNLPGIRARSYNKFTGTLDSIGAIPTYQHLKVILATLAGTKAADLMRQDDYEIMGITPTGALFGFVTDRSIDTPQKMAGKKITVLDNAPESHYLVTQTGMTPVSSTISNALQKFNNRSVDITGAPALAYEPMEMYKGLEPDGGIWSWPLFQTSIQLVGRWKNLPEGFGQKSREFMHARVDDFIVLIEATEARIPQKYWIPVPDQVKDEWSETFRKNRIALRDQGIYDKTALALFRKVRCSIDAQRSECSASDRE